MPALPPVSEAVIGLIGMGEMGKMYAERLSKGGQCKKWVLLCRARDLSARTS